MRLQLMCMPKIKSNAIALPITSAISVAIIANSAIIQNIIATGLFKNDVSFVLNPPVAIPNLVSTL